MFPGLTDVADSELIPLNPEAAASGCQAPGPMIRARGAHSTMRVEGGNLLACGATNNQKCEIYDVSSGAWSLNVSIPLATRSNFPSAQLTETEFWMGREY